MNISGNKREECGEVVEYGSEETSHRRDILSRGSSDRTLHSLLLLAVVGDDDGDDDGGSVMGEGLNKRGEKRKSQYTISLRLKSFVIFLTRDLPGDR